MNSRKMHPTSPLKHPPPTQPYPYHHHRYSLSSLNTLTIEGGDDQDVPENDSQLTHLPITSFTVADPQALIRVSRMATAGAGPSSASAASRSPASSRTKTKMLDKFGSLGKKVVKEVLGGTGNNPPQNREVIPTFGRGGAARPKVRVYGATPMPLTATKSLGVVGEVGAFDAPANSGSSSIAVQVDTVVTAGSSASSDILPTLRSSPHPSATTTNTTTDASFHFAAPSLDVPYNNNGVPKVRPHSDHPFTTARGAAAFPDPEEGRAGRLDYEDAPDDSPLLSVPSHHVQIHPTRTRTDFISMFTSSRSPSRERSLSPPPPPVPPLPLETKPRTRSSSHPPPIAHLIRDDFEFLNYPPDQLQDPASVGGSGSASRRSSRRLGRRISVATSTGSYTTARSKSRPRTTITTRSFHRRPPPLHLELSADQMYYPRPQLPEQRAYGSGLLDRDGEESMVIRYDTPAGIVSEWRDEEEPLEGGEGERTRRGKMYRLSSPMEFPPTPSSGSFDLGSRSNTATATGGRSLRTVTPGFSFAAPSEAATAGHMADERGRSRMPGPRGRVLSVAGSVQETFGEGGTPNLPLPASEESGVLPEQQYVGEQPGEMGQPQRRRRPLPSPPAQLGLGLPPLSIAPARHVSLPQHQNARNSSSGSLPSLSLPLHHHPLHHHQLGTSGSHASTHSRSSLGGFSETHSHSDAASSSIASANALLIQNALKLLAAGAPSGPPPVPPPVAVPGLHQRSSSSMATGGVVPPTSVLGLGLPISPFILPQPASVPQPPPPNLAYGPLSPLIGGAGAGAGVSSLPAIPSVPSLLFPSQPQPFSPQLGAGLIMPGLGPLSSPQAHQQAPLGMGFGSPQMMLGGQQQQQQQQFPQAMELLIALANQNLRLMAAVEQQRLEQQQQRQQQEQQNLGGGVDLRSERSAPPPPSGMTPGEALGLQTSGSATAQLRPSPSSSDRRRTRTSLLSTSTAPSHFTAASNSSSSNSSQSKRASVAHSQQTPTPPVSPRPSSSNGFPAASTPGTARTRTPSSPAISPRPPSFKRRISTPKLGRPFRISLSAVLGGGGGGSGGGSGDGASTRGLATPVEEVPPPVPPLPASLVAATNSRAQPNAAGTSTMIDTRPSTALSDYEADDDEERKRERPHSWLAEVRGWEELVLGDLSEREEPFSPSSSSAARAMAEMGEVKSPGLFSVSTSTTAAETSFSGSTRKNTLDEERSGSVGGAYAKVPFPRSRSRPREMGFASAGYAMRTGSGARTLSSLTRVGLEIFERDGRVRDSIDSMDSVDSMDSTASSNGGAMDLEELSIMTAHVFS